MSEDVVEELSTCEIVQVSGVDDGAKGSYSPEAYSMTIPMYFSVSITS